MLPQRIRHIVEGKNLKTALKIARQFYPSKKELAVHKGFLSDPMGELLLPSHNPYGFVHKYPGKLLALVSQECSVLCRFCTRKRITFLKPLKAELPDHKESFNLKATLAYVNDNPAISEVILSGGDPFTLSVEKLKNIAESFLRLPQVKVLRIHSRAPIIDPQRFTPVLLGLFVEWKQKFPAKEIKLVIHINHAGELSPKVSGVLKNFRRAGVIILSQSVLLRRVNDNATTLQTLVKKLIQNGVQPYYLHQLDRVTGSAHFEVPLEKGIGILEKLQKKLPLCMIPAYMQDGPAGKTRIM